MNRENLYVALTRGRHANHAYVALDMPDENHARPAEELSARGVLYRVLATSGAELSAHETFTQEHDRWAGHEQIQAEYDHLVEIALRPRWTRLITAALTGSGRLTTAEADAALATDAFGPLCRELHRAQTSGFDVDQILPRVAGQRTLLTAEDICAVLATRLRRATPRTPRTPAPGTWRRQTTIRPRR